MTGGAISVPPKRGPLTVSIADQPPAEPLAPLGVPFFTTENSIGSSSSPRCGASKFASKAEPDRPTSPMVRLVSLGPQDTTAHPAHRHGQGASNGTINRREFTVLGRMLRLAAENNKLMRVPMLCKLKEAPPRAGFFEPERYAAVRRRLPEDS
jgi:hypothetical protein